MLRWRRVGAGAEAEAEAGPGAGAEERAQAEAEAQATRPERGSSAAGVVLEPEVLLTHHRRLGRWLQLGGHGEGEWDPGAIALREAREESGLAEVALHPISAPPEDWDAGLPRVAARPFDLDIHEIPATAREARHLHLDLRYVLVAPPEAEVARSVSESHALGWFSIDAALALGVDASLARALRRLARLAPPAEAP